MAAILLHQQKNYNRLEGSTDNQVCGILLKILSKSLFSKIFITAYIQS